MSGAVKTNWVVITGAPSSGKTSVIDALARRGYKTLEESARKIILERMAEGLTLEEVRADPEALQYAILAFNVARELDLDPAETVFLDRGVGDSLSYFALHGLDPAPVLEASKAFRYRAVFVFERLPSFTPAEFRKDADAAPKIHDGVIAGYKRLGYDPVLVPVMPIEARAEFILETLSLKEAS